MPRRAGGNRRHDQAFGLQARSVNSARHRSGIPVGAPRRPPGLAPRREMNTAVPYDMGGTPPIASPGSEERHETGRRDRKGGPGTAAGRLCGENNLLSAEWLASGRAAKCFIFSQSGGRAPM